MGIALWSSSTRPLAQILCDVLHWPCLKVDDLAGHLKEEPKGTFQPYFPVKAASKLSDERAASFGANPLLSGIAEAVRLSAEAIKSILINPKAVRHHFRVLSEYLSKDGQDLFSQLQDATSNAVAEMLSRAVETSLKVMLLASSCLQECQSFSPSEDQMQLIIQPCEVSLL